MKRAKSLLLRSGKPLRLGAIVSGAGFLVYILTAATGPEGLADWLALPFGAVSIYVFASAAAARRRDKEAVSYNLLWGQAALALLMGACAALTLWEKLGL